MARVNTATQPILTHEGAKAKHISEEQQLRRSVMSCLLWESEFYEDGETIAKRIQALIPKVEPFKVARIAIEAREQMKLRHVPLLIVREMARIKTHKHLVAGMLERIIQRADELSEFVALYFKDKREPLSAQVKKGLAGAFPKFSAYALAKYNRDTAVKLRDVLFLCHAKPKDAEQAETWKKLIDGTLEPPDTWEVSLSATKGEGKKEAWERLLREEKLGALALLRNLRNIQTEKVEPQLIREALNKMRIERVLPFRFIAAARYAPDHEDILEQAMFKCLGGHEKLSGTTALMIDVSGSMEHTLSAKSDLRRIDAANGLAMLLREICEQVRVYTFSDKLVGVPSRRGFALADVILGSQEMNGTYLGKALATLHDEQPDYDRIIIITDEQSHDVVGDPKGKGYVINVASNQNGVGYYSWLHIDGWSEAVVDYIQEYERVAQAGVTSALNTPSDLFSRLRKRVKGWRR